jgi:hypothetical protein
VSLPKVLRFWLGTFTVILDRVRLCAESLPASPLEALFTVESTFPAMSNQEPEMDGFGQVMNISQATEWASCLREGIGTVGLACM